MRAHVQYQRQLDVQKWEQDHAQGLVPDRLPYGLNWLESHGLIVSVRDVWAGRSGQGALAAVLRKTSGGMEVLEGLLDRGARDADVVVAWEERAGIPAALCAGRGGRPPAALGMIWMTEPRHRLNPATAMLARAALHRASAVWALSQPQVRLLVDEWGVEPSRCHWLPFGVDPDFWSPASHDQLRQVVLSVGNDRHRDHGLLVRSMGMAQAMGRRLDLELVSKIDVDVGAVSGTRHEHVSHPVLRDLYRRSSLVAVATKANWHVSGITTILEAMACGKAVVATATPGMADYVTPGRTGLLVPPGDAKAMARALVTLVSDPDLARAMGREARRSIEERFNTRTMAKSLSEIVAAAVRNPR